MRSQVIFVYSVLLILVYWRIRKTLIAAYYDNILISETGPPALRRFHHRRYAALAGKMDSTGKQIFLIGEAIGGEAMRGRKTCQ